MKSLRARDAGTVMAGWVDWGACPEWHRIPRKANVIATNRSGTVSGSRNFVEPVMKVESSTLGGYARDLRLGVDRPYRRGQVLLTRVDALSLAAAAERILGWAVRRESRHVLVVDTRVVLAAAIDSDFCSVVDDADLALPGSGLVAWVLRRQGHRGQLRVGAADLMWTVLGHCAWQGVPVYLLGGRVYPLRRLQARISDAFPNLNVLGAEPQPYRARPGEVDQALIERINSSGSAIVLVGLRTPRLQHWMAAHHGCLHAVVLGVGAAFDDHAGTGARGFGGRR